MNSKLLESFNLWSQSSTWSSSQDQHNRNTLAWALSTTLSICFFVAFILLRVLIYCKKRFGNKSQHDEEKIPLYREIPTNETQEPSASTKDISSSSASLNRDPEHNNSENDHHHIHSYFPIKYTRLHIRTGMAMTWMALVDALILIGVILLTSLTPVNSNPVSSLSPMFSWIPSLISITAAGVYSLSMIKAQHWVLKSILAAFQIVLLSTAIVLSGVACAMALFRFVDEMELKNCEEREFHSWNQLTTICLLLNLPVWSLPFRITSLLCSIDQMIPYFEEKAERYYLQEHPPVHRLHQAHHALMVFIQNFLLCRCRKKTTSKTMHRKQHFIQLVCEILILTISLFLFENYVAVVAICVGLTGAACGIFGLYQIDLILNTIAIQLSVLLTIVEIMHFTCSSPSNLVMQTFIQTVVADTIRIANTVHAHVENKEWEWRKIKLWYRKFNSFPNEEKQEDTNDKEGVNKKEETKK